VYEFVKDFRNEGIDKTHNPEFSMVEWYQAYGDYNDSMKLIEEIYVAACKAVNSSTKVKYQGKVINFKRPWKRLRMVDAIKRYHKIDVIKMSREQLISFCKKKKIEYEPKMSKGLLIALIFEESCEEYIVQPTFIIDYPIETTPLAKPLRKNPVRGGVTFVERFEPYINGWEMGNVYSELNDPVLQRELFEDQVKRGKAGEEEMHPMDEDFVRAIEYGMPTMTGVGLGIDRMIMLLTDSATIRDVILFPTMKPE
jgi:lysyl-tRNA synthetase class 2